MSSSYPVVVVVFTYPSSTNKSNFAESISTSAFFLLFSSDFGL